MSSNGPTDEAVLERVGHALRSVEGLTVQAVADGVVTLSGIVASEALATTAIELARSTDGVVDVISDDLMWDEGDDVEPPTPET